MYTLIFFLALFFKQSRNHIWSQHIFQPNEIVFTYRFGGEKKIIIITNDSLELLPKGEAKHNFAYEVPKSFFFLKKMTMMYT